MNKVVAFKQKFYRCSWAGYKEAQIGKLKLVPPADYMEELRDDYGHMENMLYGNKPSFEEIIETIERLEKEINSL